MTLKLNTVILNCHNISQSRNCVYTLAMTNIVTLNPTAGK